MTPEQAASCCRADAIEAVERRTDVDSVSREGACQAIASGTDEAGKVWVVLLYNATEGF